MPSQPQWLAFMADGWLAGSLMKWHQLENIGENQQPQKASNAEEHEKSLAESWRMKESANRQSDIIRKWPVIEIGSVFEEHLLATNDLKRPAFGFTSGEAWSYSAYQWLLAGISMKWSWPSKISWLYVSLEIRSSAYNGGEVSARNSVLSIRRNARNGIEEIIISIWKTFGIEEIMYSESWHQ